MFSKVKKETEAIKVENKIDKIFPKVTQTTPAQKEIFKMVGIKNPMSLENLVW